MNQSNCIVAQSGGPTVAINASLAGVWNFTGESMLDETMPSIAQMVFFK